MGIKSEFNESDMYMPLKKFFIGLGYEIHAEVKNCDMTLLKNDKLIIIELKKNFNLQLVFQAIDRQKYCDEVYVAIPRFKKAKGSRYNDIINLVKRLGIGLITIAMDSPIKTIEILIFPAGSSENKVRQNNKKKENIISEISLRTFDLNVGGSSKKKLMTAYREKSIKIACVLEAKGDLRAAQLVRLYDCDEKAYSILRFNSYGWFESAGKALFRLSGAGMEALEDKSFQKIVKYYQKQVEKQIASECEKED